MFKVIASLKSNNGSNYLLSLCWLAFKVTWVLLQVLWKINGNYFSFAYCQIKSHFFLIPFLIFLKRATARTAWLPPRQLVYNNTNLFPLSTVFLTFFKVFLNFFKFFKTFFNKVLFSRRPRDSLTILALLYMPCQLFFYTF